MGGVLIILSFPRNEFVWGGSFTQLFKGEKEEAPSSLTMVAASLC